MIQWIIASALIFQVAIAHATDYIKVRVQTAVSNAAAIGFKANGIEQGGLGRTYSGWGPKNEQYHFGYREDHAFGHNVDCGSLFLIKNETVTLVKDGEHCIAFAESNSSKAQN